MASHNPHLQGDEIEVVLPLSSPLRGILSVPSAAQGLIVFAHGSGSSRWSHRNLYVARELKKNHWATLLMDLLTEDEEEDRANVFDIDLLAHRLVMTKNWLAKYPATRHLPIGYFGASTGAAAALVATALDAKNIFALVSRGGRPDMAAEKLPQIRVPTLLVVGDLDTIVVDLNREALAALTCEKKLELVPGATHLFDEPGTLRHVARLARNWFNLHNEQRPSPSTLGPSL